MSENLFTEEVSPELPTRGVRVTDRIKTHILQTNLGPGDLLPTEAELCKTLGVSRSSVREAIKTLDALDIVEVRHGHGTYVGELSMSALVESLTFRAMLSSRDDLAALEELIDVRQMLEQGLASRIVSSFDDELHETLTDVVAEMKTLAAQGQSFVDQDRRFHLLLMGPLENQLITQLTGAFWDVQSIVAPRLGASPAEARATAEAHGTIVEAAALQDIPQFVHAIAEHYAPIRRQIASKRNVPADGTSDGKRN